ncbi:MAG: dihydrofolate reductase [Bacteroidaceae bacterium]|nr:dihydrofolate reductase [Bacteroidaceae bacterium]
MLSIIAALDTRSAIGFKNQLLFRLPDDLRRFKQLTTGHTVLMGRKTYDSLPKGALPNRRNIVLSRTVKELPGCEVFPDLDAALASCAHDEEVFVIGGAAVYAQALPLADRLLLTLVIDEAPEADAFFPEINGDVWRTVKEEFHPADERHTQSFSFVDMVRR